MRRDRIVWALGSAAVASLALLSTRQSASSLAAVTPRAADSAIAAQFMARVRGANPVMCELAIQGVDRRGGGWYWDELIPDAAADARELVMWASSDLSGDGAVPVLGAALSDRDRCARRMAARLLGRVRNTEALQVLLDQMRAGNEETRQVAAIGLGYLEHREAVEPLLDALEEPAAIVRAAAAWALGEIEDARAIPALTKALREDSDPVVRRQAARALGEMN